ncbi:hypothetical protein H1R20_g4758, partial [Candolleomyces eurysporus]
MVEAASVQSGIGMLTMKISTLKEHLQELEEDLRMHRAVLSSVRKMPIDILGEIFHYVLPYVLDDKGRQQLIDLCLVCKCWRDAAHAMRQLWSGVSIPMDGGLLSTKKAVLWFQRSGASRKTLEVKSKGSGHYGCDKMGSRCKMECGPLAKLLADGPALDHHCQNLETLTADFRGSYFGYWGLEPLVQRQLSGAKIVAIPNLRELRLQNMGSDAVEIFEHLSTPKLVTLDLSFRSKIDDHGPDGYEFGPRLENFIKTQSKCEDTFRAFKLRTVWIEGKELIKIFEAYPLLTHLTLDDVSFGPGEMRSFWWDLWKGFGWYDNPMWLAYLEVLELLQLPPTEFHFPDLCKFIKERPPFRVRFVDGDITKGEMKGNLKRLVVMYQKTKPLGLHRQDNFHVIWRLRRECGASVEIGPMLYEDK